MPTYDVIIIGAGHAGIEASLAAARMGCFTLMLTLNAGTIGHMSCNPAIGGVGKGQLVKEIDALGGEMGKAADACGMQFRILNASKGPAVQSSRAQIDRALYNEYMKKIVRVQDNLEVKEAQVVKLIIRAGCIIGIITGEKEEILGKSVVICAGTFLKGLIHVGLKNYSGGRIGEPAASALDDSLKECGFKLLRFKTGTCPRLDKNTIDYSNLIPQEGDNPPHPFSFSTAVIPRKQVPCYITYTNKKTHKIIFDNLDKSPLYAGIIKSTGVRYCPSIEDKVVKFADKERHQVFLEPEGYDTVQVYPNGVSTSLPEEVQLEMLHSIAGLERVKVLQFGYGIEHTVVEPTQLYPSLETKLIKNLFLAGQVNGTTGYEEAGAQGLIAGINAALRVKARELFILDRASGYIGVLIDDLTTKGTNEPYRMFTSRVEYRLILREDNADLRLREFGYHLGLVGQKDYEEMKAKKEGFRKAIFLLRKVYISPGKEVNRILEEAKTAHLKKKITLEVLLKRPQISLKTLKSLPGVKIDFPKLVSQQVEIEVKYEGFIQRQAVEVNKFKNLERIRLPVDLDYSGIPSLSREIKEKLKKALPMNLGQASRISGVTPAAISMLMVYLKKINGQV
ncbi:MAG: tRNA uridine-5-carboxymethylaminomethyl(34) synthesis enzyme MnmG [Candidatus Omnitrophota bacterium]